LPCHDILRYGCRCCRQSPREAGSFIPLSCQALDLALKDLHVRFRTFRADPLGCTGNVGDLD